MNLAAGDTGNMGIGLVKRIRRLGRQATMALTALLVAIQIFGVAMQSARASVKSVNRRDLALSTRPTRSIGEALAPGGVPDTRRVRSGTFSGEGWRMRLDAEGAPAFSRAAGTVPAEGGGSANDAWDSRFSVAGADTFDVVAVAIRGDEVFVGGRFSVIGGALANNVARWDGRSWSGLGSGAEVGVNGRVDCIAASATSVYVAGSFSRAGGQPARTLARWDGVTWSSPGSDLRTTTSGPALSVDALAVDGATIFVGGAFAFAGNVPALNVVAFDETTGRWSPLGAGVKAVGRNRPTLVYAIEVTGESVYVGGRFNKAGDVKAKNIARWDRSRGRWERLGSGTDGTIRALASYGAGVYVGGSFEKAGGKAVRAVAAWDGSRWQTLGDGLYGFASGPSVSVQKLFVAGGRLVAAGTVRVAPDGDVLGLAEWDGSRWTPLGDPISELRETGMRVQSGVASGDSDGSRIAVVGGFDRVGDAASPSLATFDVTARTWVPVYEEAPHLGVGSAVSFVADGFVYLAGSGQYRVGEAVVTGVVRWDGATWEPVTPPGDEINGFVSSLVVANGSIWVGGLFSAAGDVAAHSVAMWDGAKWSALGSGVGSGASEQIVTMAADGTDLYVGGLFSRAGGIEAQGVARWDGAVWHSLGNGAENGVTDDIVAYVNAIAISGSSIYVGGLFSRAGGAGAGSVARWDGAHWDTLGGGVRGSVNTLAVSEVGLLVGGEFDQAGGVPATSLACWTLESGWDVLWTVEADEYFPQVTAIAVIGSALFVSGDFAAVDGVAARNVARYAHSEWSPLGSGLNGPARRISAVGSDVYMTGGFTAAGVRSSVHIANWRPDAPGADSTWHL